MLFLVWKHHRLNLSVGTAAAPYLQPFQQTHYTTAIPPEMYPHRMILVTNLFNLQPFQMRIHCSGLPINGDIYRLMVAMRVYCVYFSLTCLTSELLVKIRSTKGLSSMHLNVFTFPLLAKVMFRKEKASSRILFHSSFSPTFLFLCPSIEGATIILGFRSLASLPSLSSVLLTYHRGTW